MLQNARRACEAARKAAEGFIELVTQTETEGQVEMAEQGGKELSRGRSGVCCQKLCGGKEQGNCKEPKEIQGSKEDARGSRHSSSGVVQVGPGGLNKRPQQSAGRGFK